MKLKKKILLFYTLIFVIPLFVILIVILRTVTDSMLENMEYSAGQGYEQSLFFLEYKLYRTIKTSDVVVTDGDLTDSLIEDEQNYSIHQQITDFTALRSFLQTLEDEGEIFRVRLYIRDALLYSADGMVFFPVSEADSSEWYRHKADRRLYFSPPAYLEEESIVSLVRDIMNPFNYAERIGVMRIDIEKSTLSDILKKANPTSQSVSYLINSDGCIVVSSDDSLMEKYGLYQDTGTELSYSGESSGTELLTLRRDNRTFYYLKENLNYTDWAMVTLIPEDDFMEVTNHLKYLILILAAVLGMISCGIGGILISGVVRRVLTLEKSMQEVKKGNLDIHLENKSRDEIGSLYDSYNDMVSRIRGLMTETYEMGKELKTAEIQALQAQINPHFLYNTLETINWLGYDGKAEEIHSIVVSLSKFYRLMLNKGKDLLTVEEELKHAGYYLQIQSIRYSGKISYEIDVPEVLYDHKIPKLTLQPLVENAILHGILEKKEKKGQIIIRGGRNEAENTVWISVLDDGIGMSKETLAKIWDGTAETTGSGYGLKNVNRRLILIFGEGYGLSFESEIGKGTAATVKIP